ncbi:MAG: DinB family protein [Gemmatimonadaceae bacterium]|nr:DinB family protein [Gemmatimonadaceae bacterium]
MSAPEVWLRGPVAGIAPMLQPAAHTFLQVGEELSRLLRGAPAAEVRATPGGAPSIAWHARHLAASTDRLLTYAAGRPLDEAQLQRLRDERATPAPTVDGDALWAEVETALADALRQLHEWSSRAGELLAPRTVGRAALPSTVFGLLFHTAEHAQRHAGQIATTARIVRAPRGDTATASSA